MTKADDDSHLLETIASGSRYYPRDDPHRPLIESLAKKWVSRVRPVISRVNESDEESGTVIGWALEDLPTIDARMLSFPGESGLSLLIRMPLGFIPKCLALSNRAHVARVFEACNPIVADVFGDWDINNPNVGLLSLGPQGGLSEYSFHSALDVMTLALFHEMAHGLEYFETIKNSDEFRAMEACADEGAGYLFAKSIRDFAEHGEVDDHKALNRLIDAAFFLSTLIHWASPNSGNYHHPIVRMDCFLRGASLALNGIDNKALRNIHVQAYDRCLEYYLSLSVFAPDELVYWEDQNLTDHERMLFQRETRPLMYAMRTNLVRRSMLRPMSFFIDRLF